MLTKYTTNNFCIRKHGNSISSAEIPKEIPIVAWWLKEKQIAQNFLLSTNYITENSYFFHNDAVLYLTYLKKVSFLVYWYWL